MIKNILFTGATGFVGRNIVPILKKDFCVFAPTRRELDLKDGDAVYRYVYDNHIQAIVHSANPNPVKNALNDAAETMFEDSLRIFINLYRVQNICEKIIYLGSGAEYDKSMDICTISETEAQRSVPKDVYGGAKYIMNELAQHSGNVYNMRLFACYGPTDHESKFITHVIRCCLAGEDVTIRQNCYFDYIHVYDLAKIITYMLEHDLKYHDYNVASGVRVSLKEIAEKVCEQMGYPKTKIRILTEGFNKEYTANIERLEGEMHLKKEFIDLETGIAMQINYEREWLDEKKSC